MSIVEANTAVLPEANSAPRPAARKQTARRAVQARKETARKPVVKNVKKTPQNQAKKSKERDKKPRLIRDSFTIPEDEYQILVDTKKRLVRSGLEIRKTEIVRAGLALVGQASLTELKKHLGALRKLKSGRPKRK
jgi:hypothetical protein